MQLYHQEADRLSVVVTDSKPTPLGSAIETTYWFLIFLALIAFIVVTKNPLNSVGLLNFVYGAGLIFMLIALLSVGLSFLAFAAINNTSETLVQAAIAYILLLLLGTFFLYNGLRGSTHNLKSAFAITLGIMMAPWPIAWLAYRFRMGYARRFFTFDRVTKRLIVKTEAFNQPRTTPNEWPLSQISSIGIDYECQMVHTQYGSYEHRHYIIILKDLQGCCLLTIKDRPMIREKPISHIAQNLSYFLQIPLKSPDETELSAKPSNQIMF